MGQCASYFHVTIEQPRGGAVRGEDGSWRVAAGLGGPQCGAAQDAVPFSPNRLPCENPSNENGFIKSGVWPVSISSSMVLPEIGASLNP